MWSKKYVSTPEWDTVTGSTFLLREPETQHMIHLLLATHIPPLSSPPWPCLESLLS